MIALVLALQVSGGCYQVDDQTRCDSYSGGLIASAPRDGAADLARAKERAKAKQASRATKLAAAGKCPEARQLVEGSDDPDLSASVERLCASSMPPPLQGEKAVLH